MYIITVFSGETRRKHQTLSLSLFHSQSAFFRMIYDAFLYIGFALHNSNRRLNTPMNDHCIMYIYVATLWNKMLIKVFSFRLSVLLVNGIGIYVERITENTGKGRKQVKRKRDRIRIFSSHVPHHNHHYQDHPLFYTITYNKIYCLGVHLFMLVGCTVLYTRSFLAFSKISYYCDDDHDHQKIP